MTPDEVIRQLQNLGTESKAAFQRGAFKVANDIAVTAIGLAPEDTSQLVESIDVKQTDDTTTVEVGAPYAPYVEFGTGGNAAAYVPTLPEEWQAEAKQFFINGEGTNKTQPFFYLAVLAHIEELPEAVDAEIQKLIA